MTEATTAPAAVEAQSIPVYPSAAERAKLQRLQAERDQIDADLETSRRSSERVAAECAAATSKRDRLQADCSGLAAAGDALPPFAELGAAQIAAVAAFESSTRAAQAHEAVRAAANDRLKAIDDEMVSTRRSIERAELSALVAEYEARVRSAGLGQLSDQIRAKALSLSIRLEAHSPLMDREWTTVSGYPLRCW